MIDPYTYSDSDVLINKADIKDKEKLDEFENRMTNLALVSLFKTETKIKSVHDIFKIHEYLFQNVYEWAGKPRVVNISKSEPVLNGLSVQYTVKKEITAEISKLDEYFSNQQWEALRKEDYIHLITRFIAKLWQIHPFREGNTRTVSAFTFLLLKQHGYSYNAEIIKENAKFFRNALVMASIKEYTEFSYLQRILTDVIETEVGKKATPKYKKIKDYNVDDYEYAYHKVREEDN